MPIYHRKHQKHAASDLLLPSAPESTCGIIRSSKCNKKGYWPCHVSISSSSAKVVKVRFVQQKAATATPIPLTPTHWEAPKGQPSLRTDGGEMRGGGQAVPAAAVQGKRCRKRCMKRAAATNVLAAERSSGDSKNRHRARSKSATMQGAPSIVSSCQNSRRGFRINRLWGAQGRKRSTGQGGYAAQRMAPAAHGTTNIADGKTTTERRWKAREQDAGESGTQISAARRPSILHRAGKKTYK